MIAAALSIQDPRERPADDRERADAMHARFPTNNPTSCPTCTCGATCRSSRKSPLPQPLPRMCRDEFLNYLRVREWQDIHQQLRRLARTLGATLNREPATPQQIHTALLAGLLSHLGVKDQQATDPRRRHEYLGARGARFAIAPGSSLFKRSPRWVMVAELVETSRLWGRIAAAIQPEWAEPLAAHLVRREYSEPHWDAERGAVMAYEKVTLYGLPIVARRPVNYGRIDPKPSRELFIRHALVAGEWDTHHEFFHHNQAAPGPPGGAGTPGPPPRPGHRRGRPVRLLRPAHRRTGRLRRPLRPVVAAGPAPARGCCTSPKTCCCDPDTR